MNGNREYPNPFSDYKNDGNHQDLIEERNGVSEVHTAMLQRLRSSSDRLLGTLDASLRRMTGRDNDFSIYTGTTGIALLHFHVAVKRNDKQFLKIAAAMLDQPLASLRGKRVSMLTGDAGPLAVAAAVHEHLGHHDKAVALCQRLKDLVPRVLDVKDSEMPDELLYGRSGLLLALLFARRHVGEVVIESRLIEQLVAVIIASGRNLSKQVKHGPPLMYEWHGKKYFGAAHGIAGILHLLLLTLDFHPEDRRNEYQLAVKGTLDWLLSQLLPSGNLPSSMGNPSDRLVHWCHGAPGLSPLLCLAAKVFEDEKYLRAARQCGEIVWTRGLLKKGCGICHGSAGNAYTFLYLYQHTKELKYLYRALRFAEWCMEPTEHQEHYADRPLSMFEGLTGTIYFLEDVQSPLFATFPTF